MNPLLQRVLRQHAPRLEQAPGEHAELLAALSTAFDALQDARPTALPPSLEGTPEWAKGPVADPTTPPPSVLATDLHVQATYRLTEALVSAEAKMRRRIELLSEIVFETDTAGNLVFLNRAWTLVLGFPSEASVGRPLQDFVVPEDRPRFTRMLEAPDQGPKNPDPARIRFENGHRQLVWMEMSVAKLNDGGSVGTLKDVTRIKEAEDDLNKLSLVASSTDNLVIITDAQARTEWVNAAFTRKTGWELPDIIGRKPGSLLQGPDTDPQTVEAIRQAVHAGRSIEAEVLNYSRTGERYWVMLYITPIRDREGVITRFVSVQTDMTESRRLREAQKMEAIGRVASGIAHDLNNILSPILTAAEMLALRQKEDRDKKMLSMISRTAQRGSEIIKQLLTFSRGLDGKRSAVQPDALIAEVLELIRSSFPATITIQQEIAADLGSVNADSTQLHQALLNLCVNARDAMPRGGCLTLRASTVELNTGHPLLKGRIPAGRFVVIEVRDTGQGIDPRIRERIFDPFFTTKPVGKGTGLGLSTVLGIVRSHGGFVEVDSVVGEGTSFRVYLPLIGPQPAGAAPPPRSMIPTGAAQLILVVDDEAGIRETTQLALEREGYQVLTAASGEEGLGLFQQHRARLQLVMTDMMMPGMDGATMIRKIREHAPTLPIIAASGYSDRLLPDELASLNVTATLPKPYSLAVLLDIVGRQLSEAPPKA